MEECVSLAFLEFKIFHFSQQNGLHSAPNYNIEITQHKHTNPIQTINQQYKQLKRVWFNILGFLRYCDKGDMARYWVKVVSRWSWWLWVIIGFTLVEKKQCWKEIELIYEGKYSNSHIWIWMFVKWFKNLGSDTTE